MNTTQVTPDNITNLEKNEVFVFGSNTLGIHGAGAAAMARKFGAKIGVSEGMTGQCYAIPTVVWDKERVRPPAKIKLSDLETSLLTFFSVAKQHPEKTFYMTLIGCGLAGHSIIDISGLFVKHHTQIPDNVILPQPFLSAILENLGVVKLCDKFFVLRINHLP